MCPRDSIGNAGCQFGIAGVHRDGNHRRLTLAPDAHAARKVGDHHVVEIARRCTLPDQPHKR